MEICIQVQGTEMEKRLEVLEARLAEIEKKLSPDGGVLAAAIAAPLPQKRKFILRKKV